ncbi:MAG TPA: AMMECR1 domain-containing protein, partial [Gemmatimonadales bacterium]
MLLGMARAALRQALSLERGAAMFGFGGNLMLRRGAFVTLRIGEELRGCLGHINADRPLAGLIPELAVSAAQ